jgi:DNA polymerase-3 subunit epsilon
MKPTETELKTFKDEATAWAKERLADQKTVVIDVETTGLLSQDPDTEIVQLSIVNVQGRPLLSMLVKPAQPIPEEVSNIHKITNEQVSEQPTFPQIAKFINFVLEGKHLVAFNADFDIKLLWHLFKKYKISPPNISGSSCCMDKYSEWCGEWNTKRDGFKWQRLPQLSGMPSHDAFADCVSTVRVMEKMAQGRSSQTIEEDEISLDF